MTNNKYKKGDFGYYWTVTLGKEDIEGKVYDGDILCHDQGITSFYGSPRVVNGSFSVEKNKIKSFKHCPEKINGDLYAYHNLIKSFKHCPDHLKSKVFGLDEQRIKYKIMLNKIMQLSDFTASSSKQNIKCRVCGGENCFTYKNGYFCQEKRFGVGGQSTDNYYDSLDRFICLILIYIFIVFPLLILIYSL